MSREAAIARTLVEIADTLAADFDIVQVLSDVVDCCIDSLDVAAAGIMLVGPEGDLRAMASSSGAQKMLELADLQTREGPCLESFRTGLAVRSRDLTHDDQRWPRFAAEAVAAGFRSVHSMPMRLRDTIIGALGLFRSVPGEFHDADLVAAQALADVATIAILQHRATLEVKFLKAQLKEVLDRRVLIEQAKGIIAGREGIAMDEAFEWLKNQARDRDLGLLDVAQTVVGGAAATPAVDLRVVRRS